MHPPFPESWLAALALPGYTLADATQVSDGRPLVLRGDRLAQLTVVPLPDADARARCAEHLARWRDVDDPGIDPLDDAVDLGDAVALVRPLTGGTLAGFVAEQGRLSAGQASTVLVVLGRTLARLHADGLVYGRMTADDVVIADGQPRLVVPVPPLGPGDTLPPSPAEDAYHLAALTDSVIAAAYGPGAPARPAAALRALNRAVVSALGDAESRPGAGTLASLSHDIAACQPLVLLDRPGTDESPDAADRALARPGRGRRRRRSGLAVGVVVALLVAATWWVGTGNDRGEQAGVGHPSAGPPADTPTIDGPADGPAVAAAALTRARFELIARMTAADPDIDARAWAGITAVGSPAHTQALELVAVLVADGAALTGLSVAVDSATTIEDDGSTALVEVVYTTSEYAVRGAGGSTVVAAAEGQSAVLTLVRTDAGWRVSEVAEGPEQATIGQVSPADAASAQPTPGRRG